MAHHGIYQFTAVVMIPHFVRGIDGISHVDAQFNAVGDTKGPYLERVVDSQSYGTAVRWAGSKQSTNQHKLMTSASRVVESNVSQDQLWSIQR